MNHPPPGGYGYNGNSSSGQGPQGYGHAGQAQQPYGPHHGMQGGHAPPAWGYGPQPADERNTLNILGILFMVKGGLVALIGFIFVIYMALGGAFMAAAASSGDPGAAGAAAAGGVFMVIGFVLLLTFLGYGATIIYAGASLRAGKRYGLCFAIACLSCLSIPFGLILGIFTLMSLSKPHVKAMFEQGVQRT